MYGQDNFSWGELFANQVDKQNKQNKAERLKDLQDISEVRMFTSDEVEEWTELHFDGAA